MELTKQSILNHKSLIEGLEGYHVLVKKIEENVNELPDIAIESSKSLIEGLSKKALELLSEDYRNKKSLQKDCDNKLPTLVQNAFNLVYRSSLEKDIHLSLYNLIALEDKKIKFKNRLGAFFKVNSDDALDKIVKTIDKHSALRNDRGDISHGRIYPKRIESSVYLAKSIMSITDGICFFMIEEMAEIYKETKKDEEKLNFDQLNDFNEWLNNLLDRTSIKTDFSKLLYENAYGKYEEYYYIEYLPSIEILDEVIDDIYDKSFPPVKLDNEFKDLVTNSEEEDFWTKIRIVALQRFANENDFKIEGLKKIIDRYIAFNKEPLRDDIAKIMKYPPRIEDRRTILLVMMEDVIDFADDLKLL